MADTEQRYTNTSHNKRQREAKPDVEDLMVNARKIWRRKNPFQASSANGEDRAFREFFGCQATVALGLWNMLVNTGFLPCGGRMEHLLWTLMYMKVYPKRNAMSVLCGGVNKETWMKWVYNFFDAIAFLEPYVVSNILFLGWCQGVNSPAPHPTHCC